MPLKFKYVTQQEIPAELQAFYVERDGAWLLDADGVVSQSKLDEFRQHNIALTKSLRTATDELKRFEGIDPDAVRSLQTATLEKQKAMEEDQRLKEGNFQEVLAERIKATRAEFAPVLAERDALHGRLTAIQIDQAVVAEATKRGLRPTAIADITARARATFKLVNGVPQAFDGETLRLGRDGVSPETLAEWVDALVSSAPHLFEANAGSGAVGSSSGGVGSASARATRNPFRKETFNLTEQMKLQKTDPHLAARLKAAA